MEKEIILEENFARKLVNYLAKNQYYDKKTFIDYHSRINSANFSVSWSMGGTFGSCYSDTLSSASSEPEPNMVELDNFLMDFYPQTSFMQYKKIENSIERRTKRDSDYYGGSTQDGIKELSFDKLQEVLLSCGLEVKSKNVLFKDILIEKADILYNNDIKKSKIKNKV